MDGVTLGQLAARFGLVLKGDPDARVASVASLKDARAGTLSFLTNPHFRQYLAATAATAVVLDAQASEHCPVAALVTDNPYAAYARIAALLHPEPAAVAGVHADASVDALARVAPSAAIGACAVIEAGAEIGARAAIGAGAVIGVDARVGADTRIGPRVVLYRRVRVGSRCVIHAGAVLGADGFGLAQDRDGWVKVPQLGSVVVGDDVEIGANTTIDRGTIDDTVIEDGVKLDNLIQIGHNCRIGAHTAIAGCTGISGSTTVGRRCMIAGAVGIAGHLEIADDTVLLGASVVTRSLTKSGVYASGIPVSEAGEWRRAVARLRHLDDLFDRVRHLERPSGGTEPS